MLRPQFSTRTLVIIITILCLFAAWYATRDMRRAQSQAPSDSEDGTVLRGQFVVSISERVDESTTATYETPNIVEIRFYPAYIVMIRKNGTGSVHQVANLRSLNWRSE